MLKIRLRPPFFVPKKKTKKWMYCFVASASSSNSLFFMNARALPEECYKLKFILWLEEEEDAETNEPWAQEKSLEDDGYLMGLGILLMMDLRETWPFDIMKY